MSAPLPKLQQIPPQIAAVADYEAYARARMTPEAWAYMNGGAADELTLADNLAAFRRIRLRNRVLADLSQGHTLLELFGQRFAHPIFLAPVAYQSLAHPEGELAAVLGASALQAGMVVSTQASHSLEAIAAQAHSPLWFQLYIQPDRAFTEALVRRAEAAGYQALVLTVDAPVSGVRNREQRAGFLLPPGVEAVNLRGMRPLQHEAQAGQGSLLLGGPLLAAAPTWADLAWLRSLTRLPILLKGVMGAEDASRAVAEGADGLIVSNHGGRTLDGLPATIEVLAEVAAAVQGRVPLLLDGGIRRGSDVFKALALGAQAVLVGRPFIHGLATAGAVGVAHVLQLLRAELEVTMALCGCPYLRDIDSSRLFFPAL
ncbi:alpha-hydroxy acid oxidase [Pseudomonas xionganensis]|uniref:Alpha-hydroxy-acid oxidizing protein n=1 Tax=Pseudomonas xionganensis TaxID=2654845 RepID=A0A6I4KYB1_9PSED|nr:alpha-hydroxy acid oxidase [Pseudomonas xionganensis]MVW76721.1 alpha-hydroxy-acid oxidizing protein [Pseudomonas xionganensis]